MFVGREAEQAQFAALVQELIEAAGPKRARRVARRQGEVDRPAERSRVMLIHGPGGSGKSRLVQQLRTMPAAKVRAAWLDLTQRAAFGAGSQSGRAELGLVKVLGAVQGAIVGAFADAEEFSPGRVAYEFRDYRSGADRMLEYVARAWQVVEQSGRPGFPCTRSDAAALVRKVESAGLAVVWRPPGTEDPGAADGQDTAGPLSAVIAQAVTKRLPGELPPQEYALVTDPAPELIRRFAAAVRVLTARRPLVVFLDGGDVLTDLDWRWLRLLMTKTGPGVAWVLAAQFPVGRADGTADPLAQFVADLGDQVTPIPLQPFDPALISTYLRGRPGSLKCTSQEIELIARCTGGLPLAVSLAATLLDDGATAVQACQEGDDEGAGSSTARLLHRYLEHAQARVTQHDYPADDPGRSDAARIQALALAVGQPRDTDQLAALWGDSYPEVIFADLADRHDFVLPDSLRLHDEIRDAVRLELLHPDRRHLASAPSQRALNLSLARLASVCDRWPALDDQVAQSEFNSALLGAIWQASWVSNQAGLDLLAAVMPVLGAASPRTASLAVAITDQFLATYTPDQQQALEALAKHPPETSAANSAYGALIGQPGDRLAAGHILRAQSAIRREQYQDAVANLRAALASTTSVLLRNACGVRAQAIAAELTSPGARYRAADTGPALAAAEIATGLLPADAGAWRCYGLALHRAGRGEDALAAQSKALEFYPDDAVTCNNLGNTLQRLGRLPEALAAYDRALAVAPQDAVAHANKGITLAVSGDFERALGELDTAGKLDPAEAGPSNAWAGAIRWHLGDEVTAREHFASVPDLVRDPPTFRAAELAAIARCALGDPDGAEQQLLGALSLRSAADQARSRAIYELLADPPLPGIGRLRAIIDQDAPDPRR